MKRKLIWISISSAMKYFVNNIFKKKEDKLKNTRINNNSVTKYRIKKF